MASSIKSSATRVMNTSLLKINIKDGKNDLCIIGI